MPWTSLQTSLCLGYAESPHLTFQHLTWLTPSLACLPMDAKCLWWPQTFLEDHTPYKFGQIHNYILHVLMFGSSRLSGGEGKGYPTPVLLPGNPMDRGAWWAAVHGVVKSRAWLSDFTFTFHFYALEKEMATHSSVLAWRIPGLGEPGGLRPMGSHRVRHGWSNSAAAAAAAAFSWFHMARYYFS